MPFLCFSKNGSLCAAGSFVLNNIIIVFQEVKETIPG